MAPDSPDIETSATSPLTPVGERTAHRVGVKAVAASPDGRRWASADVGRKVVLWDGDQVVRAFDPLPLWERIYANRMVYALTFSHDGDALYVAATDRLSAYQTATGTRIWGYRGPRVLAFLPSSPVGIAVNPKNQSIAAAFDDGHVGIWSPVGIAQQLWFDNDAPRQLAFSRDGERLIGSDSFSICIWDAESHAKIAKHVPNERVHALRLSPAYDVAATRTLYDITIWDVDTGAESARIPIGRGLPLIAFSPSDQVLAYAEMRMLRLCDFDGSPLGSVEVAADSITSMAFSADGTCVYAGCSDGVIRLFEAPRPAPKQFRVS